MGGEIGMQTTVDFQLHICTASLTPPFVAQELVWLKPLAISEKREERMLPWFDVKGIL